MGALASARPSFLRALFLNDSTGGAGIGAGTAGDAGVGVDDVDAVALRDSLSGALAGAGAAGNAGVGDDVRHDRKPPLLHT